MFDLYYEFRKLVEALDEHQIDYALCGGLAMAVYDRARQIDMSREAVTARLQLVSQLRRLCLSLGTAKMRTQPLVKTSDVENHKREPNEPEPHQR